MRKWFSPKEANSYVSWFRSIAADGVHLSSVKGDVSLDDPLVSGCVSQMVDEGLANQRGDKFVISWDDYFAALTQEGYAGLASMLEMPPEVEGIPIVQSQNSLSDLDFGIAFAGWRGIDGRLRNPETTGALIRGDQPAIMPWSHWQLLRAIEDFSSRSEHQNSDQYHRQAWGKIRRLAIAAEAQLDDFLTRSVVLTPRTLRLDLRKSIHLDDDDVVEIEPMFEHAPAGWLRRFDQERIVPDRYDVPTPEGIVQVLITPAVKTVLEEIKRLPLRRVAGSRAQAFIRNPYSTLGEAAKEVIDEGQFETAREQAGLQYERFLPMIERDVDGHPTRIGLVIECASAFGPTSSEHVWLDDKALRDFVQKLEISLKKGFQLLGWHGYDLELDGESDSKLAELRLALDMRAKPRPTVSYAQVHDISAYSKRVEGIGQEGPYYSPYIAKIKDEEGWFPENIQPIISFTPPGYDEPVAVPLSKQQVAKLAKLVAEAKGRCDVEVTLPGFPHKMPIADAEAIVQAFGQVYEEANKGTFEPANGPRDSGVRSAPRKTLILRPNIQSLDYDELRREALLAAPQSTTVPACLRNDYALLPHQSEGLFWLQHLYALRNDQHVRGAVLADDMGLGKTLQLLTFMAQLIESQPTIAPMLVVAPVSLLENWREEADKFLRPGTLSILTAYGDALSSLRVPRHEVDARLREEDGLVNFLKPKWVGSANVVLTTYETLRDLEFSFAAERWSVMVCDEAQRIKNPAAMVTRAAKKQNTGFKIACTGTPVENTLADLWCLFDYVQPGLLGALNEFGQRYRKPIEAKTDEEKQRVEELRERIAPQILRRTKADVAMNLPHKIIVDSCKFLPLSAHQRALYAKAIDDFKRRNEPGAVVPFKNHLGLLHYLRLLCTDPQRHGLTTFKAESLGGYRGKAPKLDWLLTQLGAIKQRGEKAIVFCEFRNIQRLLQHYIEEVFGLRADIINGDTSAAASNDASRQKRIRAFQAAPGFGVIILSPIAVGFGVNIQGANHVIHYTRTWNPAKEDQATDRSYRIGQTKDVFVYYPVVRADDFSTFDVKLDQLLERKRGLAGDMLNGSGDISPNEFDFADIVPGGSVAGFDERVDLATVMRMSWRMFEALGGALWQKQGFDLCYVTPSTGDQGVDVVAIRGAEGVLIQTKSSSVENAKLGWETVKEVVGGEAYYRRRHPGVTFKKIGLTNQYFNTQAQQQAALNGVELFDRDTLEALLDRYPVQLVDLERLLFAEWSDDARTN